MKLLQTPAPACSLRLPHPLSALCGLSRILLVCLLPVCAAAQTPPDTPKSRKDRPAVLARRPAPRHLSERRMTSVKELTRYIAELKAAAPHKPEKSKVEEAPKTRDSEGSDRTQQREKVKEEEETGTDYLESYLYFLRQRAYPHDTIDWSAYPRAQAHRDRMPVARIGHPAGQGPRLLGPTWQFFGPQNLAIPYEIYYGLGPLSGRVNAVAFDPQNADTFYLAAAGGGVWKTSDSGAHWTPLSDAWPALQVSSLAVDPKNSSILYVGTGDFDGNRGMGFGMMKSMDGGTTWQHIGTSAFNRLSVGSIVVDPDNSNLITATTGRAPLYFGTIWHSTDAGTTWKATTTTQAAWSDLKVGASDGKGHRYYYATGLYNGGFVYRSADRGATWTALSPPLDSFYQFDEYGLRLATSPTDPNTVYLISGYDETIWQSPDAGETWYDITNDFPFGFDYGYDNWGQANYDITMICSTGTGSQGQPVDVLYVGLIDVDQTIIDPTQPIGSNSWVSLGGPSYSYGALVHNDQHALTINPNDPNDLLVGNDGGIYRLRYDPVAAVGNFQSLNANLGLTQFYAEALHPTDPLQMLGGTQDNATPGILGDPANWRNVGEGDGGFCAINPFSPNNQYATSQYLDVLLTTDNWNSSNDITPPYQNSENVAFIAPITLDPSHPTRLYAATNYLYRWDENIQTWTPRLGNRSLSSSGYVQYIAVAPSDSNRIYTGSVDGQLWMTLNAGSTWQEIDSGLPGFAITSISVNPTNASDILVGLSGYSSNRLYRCKNTATGPRTWTNISGSGATSLPAIPLNAIARDLDDPINTLYVAMDVGVFYTSDGGAHWANATQPLGLPNVLVSDLQVVPGTRMLTAATYGRGVWRIPLPGKLLPTPIRPLPPPAPHSPGHSR